METLTAVRKKAYQAALDNNWDRMIEAYKGVQYMYVMSPITVSNDTPFHLAVYSKRVGPLKTLLEIVAEDPLLGNPFIKTNAYGNTVLHEAVVAGNMEAVKHLLNVLPGDATGKYNLLMTRNVFGETPLYRAAACGKKEILDYLAKQPRQICDEKLLKEHRNREDSKPILHAAIQGQHFETALKLLELDPSLHELEDGQRMTCLHLLADMPSVFKSGYVQSTISFKKLLYCCLHAAGGGRDQRRSKEGSSMVERIRKDKHQHESALELAKKLIEKKQSTWWQSITVNPTKVNIETPGQGGRGGHSKRQGGGENNENVQQNTEENRRHENPPPNPLFIATRNGIVEIVEEILGKFPQGIELVNEMGQNILHVAVMHRQREIFRLVKRKNIIMDRLSSKIDNDRYTLLHQVAHVKHYRGGTMPGPALQLQEEIQWFERVLRVVPPYHALQRDKKHMTPKELFQKQHKTQLKMAQVWIEKTSQSCSAVAVLVATVVFAAAYTIPGGSDNQGFPIFLHNRFFLAFTVMDVIALASSLTSVVMFLSILTTPFECERFRHNIPLKLICGFTLLFFSVMTTMLTFACTLFLVIRLKKPLTTGLISIAAFLPVSVFAVMQYPLYVAFLTTMKDFCKEIVKSLPRYRFPFRGWFR